MTSPAVKNYLMAQRWAEEQLADSDVDPLAPQFLLQQRHGWDTTHLLLHNREVMPVEEWQWWQKAIQRLLKYEPAQYIVGQAPFYGRTFLVNQDVLIPEAETAELVEWVLADRDQQPLKVLDLGTGSGVIGITLALERPAWEVTLADVSPAALKVAQQNMTRFNLKLPIVQSDVLAGIGDQQFDLIVTNPPYIDQRDTGLMDQAVLEYEPAIALFADEHGLGFYRRLFEQVDRVLLPGGQVYGETGFDQEKTIQHLLQQIKPQAQIEPRHDVAGKMRMIHAWDFSNVGGKL